VYVMCNWNFVRNNSAILEGSIKVSIHYTFNDLLNSKFHKILCTKTKIKIPQYFKWKLFFEVKTCKLYSIFYSCLLLSCQKPSIRSASESESDKSNQCRSTGTNSSDRWLVFQTIHYQLYWLMAFLILSDKSYFIWCR
jgi:hypothetical protein